MKKKYVLKKWVKDALLIASIILIFIAVLIIDGNTPAQQEAINNCMNQGYSKEYCKKGLLGY